MLDVDATDHIVGVWLGGDADYNWVGLLLRRSDGQWVFWHRFEIGGEVVEGDTLCAYSHRSASEVLEMTRASAKRAESLDHGPVVGLKIREVLLDVPGDQLHEALVAAGVGVVAWQEGSASA